MNKVAFLNLSYNSFSCNSVWKKFFDNGDKSIFNLYIHPKVKRPSLFSDYYIDKNIPTQWGHFSLVEATIELMKAALEDKDNEYFSLISGSHFPLYDLNTMVKLIKERYPKTTFSKHFSFHTKVKGQKVLKDGVKEKRFTEYNAVCQFSLFRRREVEKFVESFDEFSRFFVKNEVIFADEFYFWAIANDLKMDFNMGQATTYSDWSFRKMPNGNLERNPRVFREFSKKDLDFCRDNNYLYVRKIEAATVIKAQPF